MAVPWKIRTRRASLARWMQSHPEPKSLLQICSDSGLYPQQELVACKGDLRVLVQEHRVFKRVQRGCADQYEGVPF